MDLLLAEIEDKRRALARMEGENKRKSVKGSFSVKKKLRVAPITKRMRSVGVTPRTAKKADTRTSRSAQMQPRKLFGSGTNSRSASRPRTMDRTMDVKPGQGFMDPVLSAILSGNYKPYEEGMKRIKANSRKVRHKNARKVLSKMPAGRKTYAKRRPKGKAGYRGVITPKWMKGETKHILVTDGASNTMGLTAAAATKTAEDYRTLVGTYTDDHSVMDIGAIAAWSLNPVGQGLTREDRNGQSIDGTYCRIQGHIHNVSNNTNGSIQGAGQQRAYVRMLVLACKGGRAVGSAGTGGRPVANFDKEQLFKKIDGSVVGFDTTIDGTVGHASSRVRSLQLGINKSYYTLLSDRKYELSGTSEGFGSSDRLFDIKIPLKQKTTFSDGHVDAWEKNQIVLVAMTVDPNMNDTAVATTDARKNAIQLEFESKYSYKDF
jgi:hypothetical protein